jgi:hypothetical protein
MKYSKLITLTFLTACVSLFTSTLFAGEITYNLYTAHENRISSTVFEFDVYVQSTGTEAFKLRTVQNTYTFNPSFINGATVNVSYVPGSSQIPTYESTLKWDNAGNGFSSSANKALTCSTNGVIAPLAPASIKVATYRVTCVAGQFGNVPAKVSVVKNGEADPSSELRLKMAVSRWDDMNCVKGTSTAVKYKEAAQSTGINQNSLSTMAPTLFPNPTSGKTTLSFNATKADKYIVKVYDATGRQVTMETIPAAQGYNSKEINLQGQAAGRYTLSIQTTDTDKESLQLIVE